MSWISDLIAVSNSPISARYAWHWRWAAAGCQALIGEFETAGMFGISLKGKNAITVFTWFCPCLQCCFSHGFVHVFSVRIVLSILTFPYRDNDVIFRILDLLSNSHAAMVDGRVFEFEPIRIVITTSTS